MNNMSETPKNIDLTELAKPVEIFPKEIYEMFQRSGLSDEEISNLEEAELRSRVLDFLPDDPAGQDRLASALMAISKNSTEENSKNLTLIAQKDPQMLIQLMALTEAFKSTDEIIKDLKAKK